MRITSAAAAVFSGDARVERAWAPGDDDDDDNPLVRLNDIKALLYVDDVALIAHSRTELQKMVNLVAKFAEDYRLEVNLKPGKTEIMPIYTSSKAKRPSIRERGEIQARYRLMCWNQLVGAKLKYAFDVWRAPVSQLTKLEAAMLRPMRMILGISPKTSKIWKYILLFLNLTIFPGSCNLPNPEKPFQDLEKVADSGGETLRNSPATRLFQATPKFSTAPFFRMEESSERGERAFKTLLKRLTLTGMDMGQMFFLPMPGDLEWNKGYVVEYLHPCLEEEIPTYVTTQESSSCLSSSYEQSMLGSKQAIDSGTLFIFGGLTIHINSFPTTTPVFYPCFVALKDGKKMFTNTRGQTKKNSSDPDKKKKKFVNNRKNGSVDPFSSVYDKFCRICRRSASFVLCL
eukprot:g45211.t1